MPVCPPTEKLQHFLDEQLDKPDQYAIAQHVAGCSTCEAVLADLMNRLEQRELPAAQRRTHITQMDPALATLMEKLREHPSAVFVEAPRSSSDAKPHEQTIQFPGPPTTAAPLGQLGPYHIIEQLATGASGLMYKAHDTKLQRTVAIKVLRRELAVVEQARARFEREARTAASLKHDHIVTVYEVGNEIDFPPYLVLEYIEGESLRQQLHREGVLTPRKVADTCRQVALGLAEAHEQGLVHRDIKPSNIMLDLATGRAKITDFGLARDFEAGSGITEEGMLAGTPSYMSPEQLTSPDQLDGRCDVYSLGVVLYECLTGELPFRGVTRMVLSQLLHDDPRPPRQLNDSIPRDLETICLKAMTKEPGRRYQAAGAFADDLSRWLAGDPITARPVGSVERLARWARRKPGLAGLSATVLVLLATVAIGASLIAKRESQIADEERTKRIEQYGLRVRAEKAHQQAIQALHREQQARTDAERARVDAEQAKATAEQALASEKHALEQSELLRNQAQQAEHKALDALGREKKARADTEHARQQAETARQDATHSLQAETRARQDAEKARQEAEAARSQALEAARQADQQRAIADEQRRLALRSLNRLGSAALEVLLQDPHKLEQAGQLDAALQRYEDTIALIQSGKLVAVPPQLFHSQVLQPALALAERMFQSEPGTSFKQRLAAIHAAAGKLILEQHNDSWELTDAEQQALQAFERAIQLDPTQPEYLLGRAEARSRLPQPDWPAVQRDAETALAESASLPNAHRLRGQAIHAQAVSQADGQHRTDLLQTAAQSLDRAIELFRPRGDTAALAECLAQRASVALDLGDSESLEQAGKDLVEASQSHAAEPLLPATFHRLGRTLFTAGKFQQADEHLGRAVQAAQIQQSPNRADCLRDWAWNAVIRNHLEVARQRAAQLRPFDVAGAALLEGETYDREQNTQRAIEAYDEGLSSTLPRDENSQVLLLAASAVARIKLANSTETPKKQADRFRNEAVDQLREAIKLAPHHSRTWYWRGLLSQQLNILVEAEKDAGKKAKYHQEALSNLQRALQTAPADGRRELERLRQELKK